MGGLFTGRAGWFFVLGESLDLRELKRQIDLPWQHPTFQKDVTASYTQAPAHQTPAGRVNSRIFGHLRKYKAIGFLFFGDP